MQDRLRTDSGFGLVELVIAMTVMTVGIFAVVAGFSSGFRSIDRASQASTAGTVADREMERFRALRYGNINPCVLTSVTTPCTKPVIPTPTGADGREYPTEITFGFNCTVGTLGGTVVVPTCTGTTATYAEKLPTKLIRIEVSNEDGSKVLVRQSSTFHASTG